MSKLLIRLFVVTLVMILHFVSLARAEPVSFRDDIARVILDHCVACHGEKKAEGGYRIDTYSLFAGDQSDSGSRGVVARDREESEVLRRITSDDVDERMPLGGDRLPAGFVTQFQQWIDEGAKFDGPDPETMLASYAPLLHPDPPQHYRQTMPIAAIHFSSDGSEIYVGGYYEITVWSTTNGMLLRRIKNGSQRSTAMDLSADGKRLAVGGGVPGKRGAVRLLDTETGNLERMFAPLTDMVLDLQWSPDGSCLAVGTAESLLRVYSLEGDEAPLTIAGHSDWVTSVAWSPDGKQLGSGSRDRTAKVFDAQSGDLLMTYSKHEQPVRGVAFHPNGSELFSAGDDKRMHRWTIAKGEQLANLDLGDQVNRLPRIGPYLFAACSDRTVRQYHAQTNEEVRHYSGHQDWALSVAFHGATKRVAAGGFDGKVLIWNSDDATLVCQFVAAPGYAPKN